jgi:transposase
MAAQSCDEGLGVPISGWRTGNEALSLWTASPDRRHIGFDGGLIDEHKPSRGGPHGRLPVLSPLIALLSDIGATYLTLVADSDRRKVVFATEGRDAATIRQFADHLGAHHAAPEQITSISMDMSPAFIKGASEHLPNARVTFDKFHVVAQASTALDKTRRIEQKTDPDLKGLRWALLKDRDRLNTTQRADLDALTTNVTTKRTARAWLYREQLRDILDRKQINVVTALLRQWCTNVMRSRVEPMKDVAQMIRRHFDGIVAWTQTRQTNGFLEAINGLFQAAKRRARGYASFTTMRTVLFLIAGKLNFTSINPHAAI